MTREEAIEILQGAIKKPNTKDGYLGQAIDMAIKALEQEPIDYKAQYEEFSKKAEIVISQLRADRDRLLETFDKIRAEIKALSNANPSYWHSGDMVDRDDILEIIDKYKEESEPQESKDKA